MALKRQETPLEYADRLWAAVDRYEEVLRRVGCELTDDGRVVWSLSVDHALKDESEPSH